MYKSIKFDGIRHWDAPDYVDAFITYAEHPVTNEPLSEAELDELNSDSDLVYKLLMSYLY